MKWLDGIIDSMDMRLGRLWEIVKDREEWHPVAHGVAELDTTEQLNNKCFSVVSDPFEVCVQFLISNWCPPGLKFAKPQANPMDGGAW